MQNFWLLVFVITILLINAFTKHLLKTENDTRSAGAIIYLLNLSFKIIIYSFNIKHDSCKVTAKFRLISIYSY